MRTTRHIPALVLLAIATVFLLSPSRLTAAGKATGSPAALTEPFPATRQQVNPPAPPSLNPTTVEALKLEKEKLDEEKNQFYEEKKKFDSENTKWRSTWNTFCLVLVIIAVSAGFGGFAHALTRGEPEEHTILWPYRQLKSKIGILGDISIGIAAGLAVFFVMDTLLGGHIKPFTDDNGIEQLLRLVAIGVICGYLGSPILDNFGAVLQTRAIKQKESLAEETEELRKLQARSKAVSESTEWVSLAKAYQSWGNYEDAEKAFELAAQKDPDNADVYIKRAAFYLRRGDQADKEPDTQRSHYDQALRMTNEALRCDNALARAYYNRACCNVRLKKSTQEVLADLNKAIDRNPTYRKIVKLDPDFKSLREGNEDFKKFLLAKGES
jgi:tetratricopeptide (TPR) repeat protein